MHDNLDNFYFSIVIPVYNAEKYLPRCLDSIVHQNVNKEVILVDDGSMDKSYEIANAYRSKFPCIRLLKHEANLGQGAARNTGILYSYGEYILLVDSDDYYEPDALLKMQNHLANSAYPDILIFSFSMIDKQGNKCGFHKQIERNEGFYSGQDLIGMFIGKKINPAPWNKVYKRKFWFKYNFKFCVGISHDDFALIPYILYKADTGIIVNDRLYNYFAENDGITNTISDNKIFSSVEAVEKLRNHFLMGGELHGISEREFQKIVFNHFFLGLKTRRHLCSDEQIIYWARIMSTYIKKYSISVSFLIKDLFAGRFLLLFYSEASYRNLQIRLLDYSDYIVKPILVIITLKIKLNKVYKKVRKLIK